MKFWIDADSWPREARDLVLKVAKRIGVSSCLVSNRACSLEPNPLIEIILVEAGEDVADTYILTKVSSHDLVFTRDIRFAKLLVEKEIAVFNDRGQRFTHETVRERASLAEFMTGLRDLGLADQKNRSYGKAEVQELAAALDRYLHSPSIRKFWQDML